MSLEYLRHLLIVIFCSICLYVRYSYKKISFPFGTLPFIIFIGSTFSFSRQALQRELKLQTLNVCLLFEESSSNVQIFFIAFSHEEWAERLREKCSTGKVELIGEDYAWLGRNFLHVIAR